MRARFFIKTFAAILGVDFIAFSTAIFGLNYFWLLHNGAEPDVGSVISFWNCPLSMYSFALYALVTFIHLFCCVSLTDKVFLLFKQTFSKVDNERTEYLRFSGELQGISEKLKNNKSELHHSQQILTRFLGYLKPDTPKKGTSLFTKRDRN